MTRPFQYDNFVQSQIAVGNGSSHLQFGSGVRKNQQQGRNLNHQTLVGSKSKVSLKNKIDELLGLCRDENDGIKNQFRQVMGAQREILDLMKQELEQPPRFPNYASSNVEMFPGAAQSTYIMPGAQNQGFGQGYKPKGNQTFPINNQGYYGSHEYQPQGHQSRPYQQFCQPQYNQPHQSYGKCRPNQLYTANYPSNYEYTSGHVPGQDDDLQIHQLQQQVLRLRNIVQDYENQIAGLSNNPANSEKVSLLRQLKDQGERIRQDALILLRGKLSSGTNENIGYHVDQGYQSGYTSGNYVGPQLISSQYKGVYVHNLTLEQQAQLRAQLNELRMQCSQLQHQNANIKRGSKRNAPGSRRY